MFWRFYSTCKCVCVLVCERESRNDETMDDDTDRIRNTYEIKN